MSAKDAELQVKEKQRLENVAAVESAEEKFMQGINKQVEEAVVELDNGVALGKERSIHVGICLLESSEI